MLSFVFNTDVSLSNLAVLKPETQEWLSCGLWKAAQSLVQQDSRSCFPFLLSVKSIRRDWFAQQQVYVALRKDIEQRVLSLLHNQQHHRSLRHGFWCPIITGAFFVLPRFWNGLSQGSHRRREAEGSLVPQLKNLESPLVSKGGYAQFPF